MLSCGRLLVLINAIANDGEETRNIYLARDSSLLFVYSLLLKTLPERVKLVLMRVIIGGDIFSHKLKGRKIGRLAFLFCSYKS